MEHSGPASTRERSSTLIPLKAAGTAPATDPVAAILERGPSKLMPNSIQLQVFVFVLAAARGAAPKGCDARLYLNLIPESIIK
jgi:hypothetical protein